MVENKTDYKDFYENGSNYVLLSADLGKMLHPEKYKGTVLCRSEKGGSFESDFTRWVAIPPLQLVVSTSPNSLEITKGEHKNIEGTSKFNTRL